MTSKQLLTAQRDFYEEEAQAGREMIGQLIELLEETRNALERIIEITDSAVSKYHEYNEGPNE